MKGSNKMKVKIGNKIYCDDEEPIMIILSDYDKSNISSMLPECHKYCSFPDRYTEKEIKEFMK